MLVGCNDSVPTEKTPSIQKNNPVAEDVNVTSVNESKAVVQQITTATKVDSTDTVSKPIDKVKTEPKKSVTAKPIKETQAPAEVQVKHVQIDASALYGEKCASCHGTKAEKQALGKSQTIAGWSASQIEEALHGYQSGSYGKEMKALMQGQAKSLSSEEIKSLAKYISTL